ncbi:GatB/YqeY domain-containing protein [Candidatus Parcubacteria bacterium]|nr:GatB/YqeY domain-containing protein [Candidatus Parcubacteria bacterium]
MSPAQTKTQQSLAITIRTMSQDLEAIRKGQTPAPRMQTITAGPPEALAIEQRARPQIMPVQPAGPPARLESVLAPKTTPLAQPPTPPPPLLPPRPLSAAPVPKPSLSAPPTPQPVIPRPVVGPTSTPKPPASPQPISSILKAKIQADLQDATRRQDAIVTSVLRLLLSAVHNAEIAQDKEKSGLDDTEIRDVIAKEVQRRKEAIAGYERGGRGELVEKERTELAVLYHYLPTPPAPPPAPKPYVAGPLPPPKPAAPLTQPVKPAFSPPAQPPHPLIPPPLVTAKPAMPPVAPPASPAAPTHPQPAAPRVPRAAGGNRRKSILLASSLAVVVLAAAGGTLWWFKFRPTPAPPPPPQTLEPKPIISGMNSAVVTTANENISREETQQLIQQAFALPVADRSFEVAFIKTAPPATNPRFLDPAQILNLTDLDDITLLINPTDLQGLDLFRFGQTEFFADNASLDRQRFGMVFKFKQQPTTSLDTFLAMTQDLEPYLRLSRFGGNAARAMTASDPNTLPVWQTNTYRGVTMKYVNFDSPDISIDMSLLPAQNLLLVATSRESMFGLIDLVLNQPLD